MSTILAIETSTEIASAAILVGERILSLQTSGVQNHSSTILPMLQNLLQQAGLRLQDCDAIAFGAGPGSFTGVRTACGIAQGLAFGLNVPVCPVPTLLAMAQRARQETGASSVMPVLDARMGEVYWARYRHDSVWQTEQAPALSNPASLGDAPWSPDVMACGNGLLLCAPPGALAAETTTASLLMPHAAQIATLGQLAFAAGQAVAAAQAQPLYLRNKVAQTTAERAQRGVAR